MNTELIIIGYSGHSYVCIEIAKKNNYNITGYCDLEKKKYNPYNLNYLGNEKEGRFDKKYFITIANNNIRKNIFSSLPIECLNTKLIHTKSVVSESVDVGIQTIVGPGAIINSKAQIGRSCIINSGAIIEHECIISDFVHIAPGASLLGAVKIGEKTFIGSNSVIKQGVKITRNVIVGAGSVVIDDIFEQGTYVGIPAKKIK
tara:strand:- start:236 stop:841 length:606 start_codon:yes stop_codon:yes gene_type:complete